MVSVPSSVAGIELDALPGTTVCASDGSKIGKVKDVFEDDSAGIVFAAVSTGWFSGSSFVPLDRAFLNADDCLQVPFEEAFVKDAPRVEGDDVLSREDESRLYSYYGIGAAAPMVDDGEDAGYGTDYDVLSPTPVSAAYADDSDVVARDDISASGEGFAAGDGSASGEGSGLRLRRRVVIAVVDAPSEDNFDDVPAPASSDEQLQYSDSSTSAR